MTRSAQARDGVGGFEADYLAFLSSNIERVRLMETRLAELQDEEFDLAQKEEKLRAAAIESNENLRKFVYGSPGGTAQEEVGTDLEEFVEEEQLDLDELPEEREARLEGIKLQIEILNAEIEALPPHLRADPIFTRDELEVELLQERLSDMEPAELEEATMKINSYELRKLEQAMKKMSLFQKIDVEDRWTELRKAVYPDDFPEVPEDLTMLQTCSLSLMPNCMPDALCAMPDAPSHPMPYALTVSSTPHVLYPIPHASCLMPYAMCAKLFSLCHDS